MPQQQKFSATTLSAAALLPVAAVSGMALARLI